MDILSYLMGQNSAIKKGMKVEVVTELPATGETNVIYLVPKEDTEENDIFNEYLYIDDEWELIGTTDIDLSGYQTKIDSTHKLSSDLVDDTNNTNKFVTSTEKSTWGNKYDKPLTGIPKTDLENDVQTSLGKADNAEQAINKVTSLSASSTDTEYPSAKAVYDALGVVGGDPITYINSNTLVLAGKKKGIYVLDVASSNCSYYVQLYQNSSSYLERLWFENAIPIVYILKDIPEQNISASTLPGIFAKCIGTYYDNPCLKEMQMVATRIDATNTVIKNYVTLFTTLASNQTISGKKTFSTLPESSVTPTTANQLVNKSYVDGLVGNISTVLSSLTTVQGGE